MRCLQAYTRDVPHVSRVYSRVASQHDVFISPQHVSAYEVHSTAGIVLCPPCASHAERILDSRFEIFLSRYRTALQSETRRATCRVAEVRRLLLSRRLVLRIQHNHSEAEVHEVQCCSSCTMFTVSGAEQSSADGNPRTANECLCRVFATKDCDFRFLWSVHFEEAT